MTSLKIKSLKARIIFDSRGFPTIEADAILEDGTLGRAMVPSGASTGSHEAVELRDGDKSRYHGKGVSTAVSHVQKEISEACIGQNAYDQEALDQTLIKLDGTRNKSKLGANAMLSVSLAVSRAAAASLKTPLYRYLRNLYRIKSDSWLLPTPMLNVINGGKHADSGLNVQEFMLVPINFPSLSEALRAGSETYQTLKKLLAEKKLSTSVGDEGGFAPRIKTHEESLDILSQAITQSGYQGRIRLALDAAASEFYQAGNYIFESQKLSAAQMTARYKAWVHKYGLISLEDPLAEDDWTGWKSLTSELGSSVRVIGDDIFVTNPERLDRGIKEGVANAILIKLNQIGTLTETVKTVLKAQQAGYNCVISHRSGETEDPYIADLTVALNAGAIKSGAPCRSERLCKYNQLIRIEEELGAAAHYAGEAPFSLKVAG
jgi:enolase